MLAKTEKSIKTNYKSNTLDKTLRKAFIKKLSNIKSGSLTIIDPIAKTEVGTKLDDSDQNVSAVIRIKDLKFYRLVALRGALGAGEAYIEGMWTSDNLVDLIRIMALNIDVMDTFEKGTAYIQKPLSWLFSMLTRNTLEGSKRNIHAHYDLSNEMFALFLDSKMMYSSAFYPTGAETLEEASEAKLDRICKKMNLSPEDHILEIGTGWGGFAVFAAKNYGCKVTTTTISNKQFEYAKSLVKKEGLEDKIELLLSDYRDLQGEYDKIVSIEMIEAVGAEFLDTYLETCSKLLKPDGSLFLQAITINDQVYDRALKEVDFIKKYIFPGSFIPSVNAIIKSSKKATDLRMYHLEDMTPHYAMTLLDWRHKFLNKSLELNQMGFDKRFIRMWDYYFCYCAGGFMERSIGSVQLIFGKPRFREDMSVRTQLIMGG